MAEQQQQHMPGGHYSGANPVPTVKKFLENLDKDKRERDRKIDEGAAAQKMTAGGTSDAVPHKPVKAGVEGTQKTVTDPTTGNEVVIEDVNKDMIKQVENPQVCLDQHQPRTGLIQTAFCAQCKSTERYSKLKCRYSDATRC